MATVPGRNTVSPLSPSVPHTNTKAHWAAAGGGVGGALALLLIYFLDLDRELEGALTIILTAALSWIATYYAPRNVPVEGAWPPPSPPPPGATLP